MKNKSEGEAYFDEQKIEILLKERLQNKLSKFKKEIFDKLKSNTIDSKENELFNKKASGKDMLMNAVFLIEKNREDEFTSNVNKIKLNYSDLEFQIWGPFPPYNFVK